MFDEHLQGKPGVNGGAALPLFYRKKTSANGESDEMSLGPCVVYIFKWMVGLIVAAMLMLEGERPAIVLRYLLRLFCFR